MSNMNSCCVMRFVYVNKPVCSTGRRDKFYYPNGGFYSGYWRCNKHHLIGKKETATKNTQKDFKGKSRRVGVLIYQGSWQNGLRHGQGVLYRRYNGEKKLVYSGAWKNDMKCGEGRQIYLDGCAYFGQWHSNRRHGRGVQWYKDGGIYLGEWQVDLRHGAGVMIYPNGNQYQGNYALGYKNGEGTFYHYHTGQIQKGMWENDIAKTSIMQDEMRGSVDQATPYPIPKNELANPDALIRRLFQPYKANADLPRRCLMEPHFQHMIHKFRHFVSLEERYATPSIITLYDDLEFICTCEKQPPLIALAIPESESTCKLSCAATTTCTNK